MMRGYLNRMMRAGQDYDVHVALRDRLVKRGFVEPVQPPSIENIKSKVGRKDDRK